MDFLKIYTIFSITLVLFFVVTPIAITIANYNPSTCFKKALEDLATSTALTRIPIEIQKRGELTVIVIRWLDLGSLPNSLLLPLIVSIIATALGLVYSLSMYIYRFPKIFTLLPLLAYLPIPFVKPVALQTILDPDIGFLNRFLKIFGLTIRVEGLAAVAIYQIISFFPLTYALNLSYLLMLPREFVETSYSLGSSAKSTILKIVIPLLKPSIFTSLSLTYILSLEDLEAPLIFEGYPDVRGLLSYKAYTYFISEVYRGFSLKAIGYTLILLLITISIFIAIAKYLTTVYRNFGVALVKPINIYRYDVKGVGIAVVILVTMILISSLIPTFTSLTYIIVNPLTLEISPSIVYLLDATRIKPTINTVIYTLTSLFLAIIISLPIAYWISRRRTFYRLVEALALTPLPIPGIAIAYTYIEMFRNLPLNPFNTPWIYIITLYTFRRLPYVYIVLKNTISSIPLDYEEVAQNLGASNTKILTSIVSPLTISTSLNGLAIASITIATEVSSSITIGGLGTTQGWGSEAPLVYMIYRDITVSSIAVTGVYTVAILIAILITITISRIVLYYISKKIIY
jgi:ABC-type Fe3+ transport system permease subunit